MDQPRSCSTPFRNRMLSTTNHTAHSATMRFMTSNSVASPAAEMEKPSSPSAVRRAPMILTGRMAFGGDHTPNHTTGTTYMTGTATPPGVVMSSAKVIRRSTAPTMQNVLMRRMRGFSADYPPWCDVLESGGGAVILRWLKQAARIRASARSRASFSIARSVPCNSIRRRSSRPCSSFDAARA
jgi:hypothetical protein